MISNNEPYFTHVKLQTSDFLKKSAKLILFFMVLNIILIPIINSTSQLQNFYVFKSGLLGEFNNLFLWEGAIFFILSPMGIAIRPVKDKSVQIKDVSSKRFLQGSFIDKILSREFIVRKTNVYGIVGFITGSFLIIFSIIIDMLFISKKIF